MYLRLNCLQRCKAYEIENIAFGYRCAHFSFDEKNQDIDWSYEEMKNKIEQKDKTF